MARCTGNLFLHILRIATLTGLVWYHTSILLMWFNVYSPVLLLKLSILVTELMQQLTRLLLRRGLLITPSFLMGSLRGGKANCRVVTRYAISSLRLCFSSIFFIIFPIPKFSVNHDPQFLQTSTVQFKEGISTFWFVVRLWSVIPSMWSLHPRIPHTSFTTTLALASFNTRTHCSDILFSDR